MNPAERAFWLRHPEAFFLRSVRSEVSYVRACLQDSVDTHGTHGGWLDELAGRLSRLQDDIDCQLPIFDPRVAFEARVNALVDGCQMPREQAEELARSEGYED